MHGGSIMHVGGDCLAQPAHVHPLLVPGEKTSRTMAREEYMHVGGDCLAQPAHVHPPSCLKTKSHSAWGSLSYTWGRRLLAQPPLPRARAPPLHTW